MKYAIEMTGTWYGIELPSWLRFFDCRSADDYDFPTAPWGQKLLAGEKAEVDLGLRRGYAENDATTLVSCTGCMDLRKADHQELVKQLTRIIKEAEKFLEAYQKAQRKLKRRPANPDEGGSCMYLPVAADIGNYGWGIIGDKRSCIVLPFNR